MKTKNVTFIMLTIFSISTSLAQLKIDQNGRIGFGTTLTHP
jgi:hypothetical protein